MRVDDFPQLDVAALHVRDAAGLRPAAVAELPPLEPAVPLVALPGVDEAAAAEQWGRWWARRDVGAPRSLPVPEHLPADIEEDWRGVVDGGELRALLAARFADGLRWCSRVRAQRHAELPPHERSARWGIGELVRDELIVTCALADDPAAVRERLREALTPRV